MTHSSLRTIVRVVFTTLIAVSLPVDAAEWPIAELPEVWQEKFGPDDSPGAAVVGEQTLVVWNNRQGLRPDSDSVYGTILDERDTAGRPFLIRGAAAGPTVASNGSQWLVAYSYIRNLYAPPFTGVAVRSVYPNGTVGPQVTIGGPDATVVGTPRWRGDHWVVGLFDGRARVVFLEPDLTQRHPPLEVGVGGAPVLREIDGLLWAFCSNQDRITAVEVGPDARSGRRHEIVGPSYLSVAAVDGRTVVLLTTRHAAGLDSTVAVTTFDAAGGFAPGRPLLAGQAGHLTVIGNEIFIVHSSQDPAVDSIGISRLNVDDTVQPVATLPGLARYDEVQLVDDPRGPLLLVSAERGRSHPHYSGIHALRLENVEAGEIDLDGSALLSRQLVGEQGRPLIVSTGDGAVVFWNQLDESLRISGWSRRVDAGGSPVGSPVRLPFHIERDAIAAATSKAILLLWPSGDTIVAARLGSDGIPIGEQFPLATGYPPSIAARGDNLFVVWSRDFRIRGTPLRDDGGPLVPEGFEILPSTGTAQHAPVIAATDTGFHILWAENGEDRGARSVIVSDHGAVLSSSTLSAEVHPPLILAASRNSALAASNDESGTTLYPFGENGPLETIAMTDVPDWKAIRILELRPDVYALVFEAMDRVFVREVTMDGASTPSMSPPRLLSRHRVDGSAVTIVNGSPLAVWVDALTIYAGTADMHPRRGTRRSLWAETLHGAAISIDPR